ncbi:MAG: DUF2312 domain-containing protein [Dongiaceae bacterium]
MPPARETSADSRLRAFVNRIERLEEEKAGLSEDIREVYAEAKGNGFETKIMRMIVQLRKMEPHQRDGQDHLLELYRKACGVGK